MATTLSERAAALQPVGLAPLLTQAQLAAYYGVSDWTVRQWVNNGCPMERLPGGKRRFDLQKVDDWAREQADDAVQATAEKSANALAARRSA